VRRNRWPAACNEQLLAGWLGSGENGLSGDARDYDEMNRVWREFFPVDPPTRPACALQLSNGNGIEIECIAFAGKSPS
jgi:hypothetical protein